MSGYSLAKWKLLKEVLYDLYNRNTSADVDTIEQVVYEIGAHLHNRERWFGKLGTQTATAWGDEASLAAYRAISGDGDFGGDTSDEAQVIGTADTPVTTGMIYFDFHRIVVTAASTATDWVLRIVYGDGTMAAAEEAGQYTDVMFQEGKKGAPIDVLMPRTTCASCKVWLRAKNATNNATVDFFVGIHEYER